LFLSVSACGQATSMRPMPSAISAIASSWRPTIINACA
jgi:hypothetical protein